MKAFCTATRAKKFLTTALPAVVVVLVVIVFLKEEGFHPSASSPFWVFRLLLLGCSVQAMILRLTRILMLLDSARRFEKRLAAHFVDIPETEWRERFFRSTKNALMQAVFGYNKRGVI